MEELLSRLNEFFTSERFIDGIKAGIILVVGVALSKLASSAVRRVVAKRLGAQQSLMASRALYYLLMAVVGASVLRQLGFDLSVLLGAAGVLTVAIGFASQTSASNIISGLFLLGERPFVVGDIITVGGTIGTVESIDLLSVKLRTFDNLSVRVPNETLLKTQLTNFTRYPIRRLDMAIGVGYEQDLERVKNILLDTADANPLSLDEPPPMFLVLSFGDSAINVQLSVWTAKENILDLRNSMYLAVKEALDSAGVPFPYPQQRLTGSGEELPIRVVGE